VGVCVFLAGRGFCVADDQNVEKEPEEEKQEEETNWREAIDQILGIEVDVGLPVEYYGNASPRLGSRNAISSALGCSAILNITSFLGAGFYLKDFHPTKIGGESDHFISTGKGGDYEEANVSLTGMLFGPVFTYPGNRSRMQLKLALGYHIALFHFNVSDPVYRKYNTEEYYRKYTGFGGNLTAQGYLTLKTYVYLRVQYSYGQHSGYSAMHSFGTSCGFGISIPNIFKSFPDKKKPAEEESTPADG
jgi:hypothetical protein